MCLARSNLGMDDRPGSYFRVRTSEDKVCRKDMCWSVRAARRKRARPRGGGTLQNGIRADSRDFTGTYGRKCTGMSTGACGRRWHRHVDGCVAGHYAGIWDALLALDARTGHRDRWHWTHERHTWAVATGRTGRGQERTFLAWD